jgi:uncharacterized BrkB/YihY/UPF0761 family membrane protein
MTQRSAIRGLFWILIVAAALFGVVAGTRGPTLLIAAIAFGAYDLIRHRTIPTLGYVLLSVGLVVTAAVFYWLPLLRAT